MCGIFACTCFCEHDPPSASFILKDILRGLSRLEYRGYDSAGIAYHDPKGKARILKRPGKIAELEGAINDHLETCSTRSGNSTCAIGHTRWATHGEPSEANTHPVGDTNGFLAVHNGIVTNHKALKESLIRAGYSFIAETDSEVIPKLADYVYKQVEGKISLQEIARLVCDELEGAFALVMSSSLFPNEIVAARRGSPLLLGKKSDDGKTEQVFLASDATALAEHTDRVVVLEDDDVAHVTEHGFQVYSKKEGRTKVGTGTSTSGAGEEVERLMETLQMEIEEISRGEYDHFMYKEICEQTESVKQTLKGRIRAEKRKGGRGGREGERLNQAKEVNLGGLAPYIHSIKNARRIVLVACGTSLHASIAVKPTLEALSTVPVNVELASDLLDRGAPMFRDDAFFFVSQSGETADTMRALENAIASGALCLGVTNTVGSSISRRTHAGVHLNAGAEVGVASTKAYTSQLTALSLVSLALSHDSKRLHTRRMRMISSLDMLHGSISRALGLETQMKRLAGRLRGATSLLAFGRGHDYATCLEGALKLKEVALLHSEGIHAGELKHGPLALVDESMPILVIATSPLLTSDEADEDADEGGEHDWSNAKGAHRRVMMSLQQLRARRGNVIALVSEGDCEEADEAIGDKGELIQVPRVDPSLQSVVNIVPLQLLSYHLALAKGLDVDRPRNLAKSVTTE